MTLPLTPHIRFQSLVVLLIDIPLLAQEIDTIESSLLIQRALALHTRKTLTGHHVVPTNRQLETLLSLLLWSQLFEGQMIRVPFFDGAVLGGVVILHLLYIGIRDGTLILFIVLGEERDHIFELLVT